MNYRTRVDVTVYLLKYPLKRPFRTVNAVRLFLHKCILFFGLKLYYITLSYSELIS